MIDSLVPLAADPVVPLSVASERAGVPLSTLYRWVRWGLLPTERRRVPFSMGPQIVRCVHLDDVEDLAIARSRVRSDPAARR